MSSRNVAVVLFTKACHDWNAASRLVDVDPLVVGDQVFGLLLQQSVEKAIKSLIATTSLRYDHTHDIHHLIRQLSKKIDVPEQFSSLDELTLFASREKYEAPISEHALDRTTILTSVQCFLEWVSKTGAF